MFHDPVLGENAERHLLDALLVEAELALVLGQEGVGELAERGCAAYLHEGADEEGLVDMTHPHPFGDEGQQFVEAHQAAL